MVVRSLHVAEKPSVAKSIAQALAGSRGMRAEDGRSQYNRIYCMQAEIGTAGTRPVQR